MSELSPEVCGGGNCTYSRGVGLVQPPLLQAKAWKPGDNGSPLGVAEWEVTVHRVLRDEAKEVGLAEIVSPKGEK